MDIFIIIFLLTKLSYYEDYYKIDYKLKNLTSFRVRKQQDNRQTFVCSMNNWKMNWEKIEELPIIDWILNSADQKNYVYSSFRLSVRLSSVCPPTWLFVRCLSVCPSACLSVYLTACLFVCLSSHPLACMSACQPACPSDGSNGNRQISNCLPQKNCGSVTWRCGLQVADLRKMRSRNIEIAVAELHFFNKLRIELTKVFPSSCGITVADLQKFVHTCPLLSANTQIHILIHQAQEEGLGSDLEGMSQAGSMQYRF